MNKADPPEKWPLDKLCERMILFFPQLGQEKSGDNALTTELVLEECDYDYEEIRYYLRERAAEAYQMKVILNSNLGSNLRSKLLLSNCQSQLKNIDVNDVVANLAIL